MKKHRGKKIKFGIPFQWLAILYLISIVVLTSSPTTAFFHTETVKLDGNILADGTFAENVEDEAEADEEEETRGDSPEKGSNTHSTGDMDKPLEEEEGKVEESVQDEKVVDEKSTDETEENTEIIKND